MAFRWTLSVWLDWLPPENWTVAVQQAEAGTAVKEVYRQIGETEQTSMARSTR